MRNSTHMKLKLLFIMTLLGYSGMAQKTGNSYTLEECIDYGLKNNIQVQNAQLDEEIAKAKVKETVGIGLPQVSGSVALQHSPDLQRFFSRYDTTGGFSFVDPAAANAIGLDQGEVFAAQNFFQLKSVGTAELNINQLIFNGSYIVGLQASNAYKDLSVKQANQTKEENIKNISMAFYNLLIMQERLELVESNLKRIKELYETTAAMQENGFAEKIDVDRLKVNLNNLNVAVRNTANGLDLAQMLLKFQMNYPMNQELDIEGSLENVVLQQVEGPDSEWNYSKRTDYQVLEANKKLQELNIKNKYAEALPSIGAFANIGYMTQAPSFGGLFKTESDFTESDQIGTDGWYNYTSVGLALNWNFFTGLQRSYQIQQEKLNLQKIDNSFKMLENNIEMEVTRNQDALDVALETLDVQSENLDLATNIYEISQIKYEEGVGSSLEVTEADAALKEAQTNYYSALYDAIVAQIELKKSLGTLYNK